MRIGNVKLNWLRSVSTDVVKQHLSVAFNGNMVVDTDLSANTESHVAIGVHDGDEVDVFLVAIDGAGNMSLPASLEFVAVFPDQTAPESPTFVGQGWSLQDVHDEEPVE